MLDTEKSSPVAKRIVSAARHSTDDDNESTLK